MITVWMVQPAVYEVVDMVTIRNLFMSAIWTVRVCAVDLRRAFHRICCGDRENMFVHVIFVPMMKMAIVKIIDMAVMEKRGVPAIRAMLMSMVGMVFFGTCRHWLVLASALWAPSFWSIHGIGAEAAVSRVLTSLLDPGYVML